MNVSLKYSQNEVSTMSQVDLEMRALIKSASALNRIRENWDVEKDNLSDALDKNRLLWTVLATAMQDPECPQPANIRNNIISLAVFIFQRTVSLLSEPKAQGLDILISINMNIAKGLGAHDEVVEEASKPE